MTLGPNAAGVPNSAIWLATFSDTSLTDHVIRLTVSPTGAPVVDKVVALPTSWHTFDITGGPVDPVTNRQHDVWLTDDTNDRLGRVDTAGALTTWPVALSDPDPPKGGNQSTELGTGKGVNTPTGITVGPDNKLWVSVKATNSIARFDPDANAGAGGFDQQYRALSGIVRPLDVAVGSDHNIWYASVDDVKIGRVVLDPPAAAPYTPSPTFTLSGRFDYYFPGANYPFHQTGWPMGITSWGGYLDVAMTESDRIQRVPTSLAGGPPDADHEVQDSNVQDPGPATNPWRTLRPGPNTWPRKFASDVGGQHAEWVTMGNDTAYQILPGTASTGEVVTPRGTVTGAAACCLTVAGLIYISGLDGIAAGANGAVLATEFTSSHIVRLDTGAVQEDTLPTPDAGPTDIVAAPDGSYWFTETKVNQIGLRNSNGNYTEFPLPAGDTEPYAITLGPDGAPWFTLRGSGQIGRLDPVTHQVTTYTAPSLSGAAPRATQPTGIHLGPDGQLYVTEFLTGDIVRFDPATSQWTGDWTLPFGDLSRPFWMTTGPDGHIWVTLPYQDQIARLNV
jgi:streptogramin lyase